MTRPDRSISLDVLLGSGTKCQCGCEIRQGQIVALREFKPRGAALEMLCVECAVADLRERSEFGKRLGYAGLMAECERLGIQ